MPDNRPRPRRASGTLPLTVGPRSPASSGSPPWGGERIPDGAPRRCQTAPEQVGSRKEQSQGISQTRQRRRPGPTQKIKDT